MAVAVAAVLAFLALSDESEPLASASEPAASFEELLAEGHPRDETIVSAGSSSSSSLASAPAWSRVSFGRAVASGADQQTMVSVTAGGPGFVAVGYAASFGDAVAAVWTSSDGVEWSRVAHDEAVFGASSQVRMRSVAVGGSGLVAVGVEDRGPMGPAAAVWTSVGGITWSRVPDEGSVFLFSEMNSVAAGGPGLVAVGTNDSDAEVWTSVDGSTWARVPRDDTTLGGLGFQSMVSVTVGGPGLVAVGFDAEFPALRSWSSSDGVTWAMSTVATTGTSAIRDVTAAGPGLVAVGSDMSGPGVWTSVDGVNWSGVSRDEGVLRVPGRQSMLGVTSAGAGIVAVGVDDGDAAVWMSADSATWSRVEHDASAFGPLAGQRGRMESVTAGGPGIVAVGSESTRGFGVFEERAAVWTSVDGLAWSRVAHDEAVFTDGSSMASVTVGGLGLVAVGVEELEQRGRAALWTSVDGLGWSRVALDEAVFTDGSSMASVTVGGQAQVWSQSDRRAVGQPHGPRLTALVGRVPPSRIWSRTEAKRGCRA